MGGLAVGSDGFGGPGPGVEASPDKNDPISIGARSFNDYGFGTPDGSVGDLGYALQRPGVFPGMDTTPSSMASSHNSPLQQHAALLRQQQPPQQPPPTYGQPTHQPPGGMFYAPIQQPLQGPNQIQGYPPAAGAPMMSPVYVAPANSQVYPVGQPQPQFVQPQQSQQQQMAYVYYPQMVTYPTDGIVLDPQQQQLMFTQQQQRVAYDPSVATPPGYYVMSAPDGTPMMMMPPVLMRPEEAVHSHSSSLDDGSGGPSRQQPPQQQQRPSWGPHGGGTSM